MDNIRKIFIYIYFFFQLIYKSDPSADFCVLWLKPCGLMQKCASWELQNLKINIQRVYLKNSKNYNAACGEN